MSFSAGVAEEADRNITRRCVSEGLEELLHHRFDVLDHGFVRVVDYMGNDAAIVQAARVSYGKGTKQINQDRGLIRYLMRHKHTTPFEMCEIKFHVKLPIFVARQWIRHRTASVNEYSARYSILDKEFYIPAADKLAEQSMNNKQGRGEILDPKHATLVLDILRSDALMCYEHYLSMLGLNEDLEDKGESAVARELARINLPVNFYTQWYWKVNLHNLIHFLKLRADPHAQYEIRAYAEVILNIMKLWVPYAYEAFESYVLHAKTFSKESIIVLQHLLKDCDKESLKHNSDLMSKREWDELMSSLFPDI